MFSFVYIDLESLSTTDKVKLFCTSFANPDSLLPLENDVLR